ncbi:hypothetical protein M595_1387 [Lyngbya aestuarii BL J]|uniref:Uncharacterized protein n=1 Tax=Lyngbya aestuarii BL J TaxID=1348334 RepID=U7QL08_9CYAN|nr:hypothetical protein M595_1387 [Lyngbya aestuarii BL J]
MDLALFICLYSFFLIVFCLNIFEDTKFSGVETSPIQVIFSEY